MRVLLTVPAALLVLATGCNRAADEQRKADEARAEANEDISEAQREANLKIQSARDEASKEVAEARNDFTEMRDAFRKDRNEKLAELDKDIAELETEAKTATGKKKTELDAELPQIRTQRDAFVKEYSSLDTATAATWDAGKERVEKAWTNLKKAVDDADD